MEFFLPGVPFSFPLETPNSFCPLCRFENWEDPDIPPFHYGSHYSSAGIVLYYLVRLPPFNHLNQQLQGGKFDHADRMFVSLADTWRGASQGNTADVKELIPEFYYLPEFLENRMQLDLGAKQSGEQVRGRTEGCQRMLSMCSFWRGESPGQALGPEALKLAVRWYLPDDKLQCSLSSKSSGRRDGSVQTIPFSICKLSGSSQPSDDLSALLTSGCCLAWSSSAFQSRHRTSSYNRVM